MSKNILKMKDKYGLIYQFMIEVLKLEEAEALKNTLKLEAAISEGALIRLKSFIRNTKSRLLTDQRYSREFKRHFIREAK